MAVTRLGLHSRLWLLSICTVSISIVIVVAIVAIVVIVVSMLQLMATPFAILTLYLEPPHAFATLFAYYFFGKTLFAYFFFGNNP